MVIIEYCPKCKGTGYLPVGEGQVLCNRCSWDGQLVIGKIDSSNPDILTDILKYCEWIKEKLEKMSEGK
jgi:hypothetical protein